MGHPVVHFEVIGRDARMLQAFYAELFGWAFETGNPMGYGTVERGDNVGSDGAGIGGGVGGAPEGYAGHVTFYVRVPDLDEALVRAERLGGRRLMGPETVTEGVRIAQFADPESHLIGLIQEAG